MASIVERIPNRQATARPAGQAERIAAVAPVLAVFLVGLVLRLYGLNWDGGGMFHPDERFILMTVEGNISLPWPIDFSTLFDPKISPLNPHFFAYGSLPLYLLKFVAHIAGIFQQSLSGNDLRFVGRALGATLDAGSILLTFAIGRRTVGKTAGLIAAALVAFAPLHIQLSHFYAVDTMLVFFILVTLLLCLKTVERPSTGLSLLTGVFFGLALATKVSVAPLAIAVVVAHVLAVFDRPRADIGRSLELVSSGLILAGCATIGVFLLAQPFTLFDKETFIANVTEQSEMVRRIRDYPYTRQYINTAAFWYPISQVTEFGLGIPFGIAGWLGSLYALGVAAVKRNGAIVVLLSWFIPYFIVTGAFDVKFLRYLLPLVPLLAIFGAKLLVDVGGLLGKISPVGQWAGRAVMGGTVLATFLMGYAYVQIYTKPHTAISMSRWINANVNPGSLILKEHWEEGLTGLGAFRQTELNLYDPDDATKLKQLDDLLPKADYILFYSNRLYATIPRLPARYPMTSEYYRLLFSGQLGYELVHAEASYPTLAGVSFRDNTFTRPGLPEPAGLSDYLPSPSVDVGFADESYSVYDHPLVLLFKRTSTLSQSDVDRLLGSLVQSPAAAAAATRTTAKPTEGLLLPAEVFAADQRGGTWRDIFDVDSLANRYPFVVWLLTVELIGLVTLPIGMLVLGKLADRGWVLSKTLGILLVSWLAWLGASMRVVPYERWSILLALTLVAGVSIFLAYRRREWLAAELRLTWKTMLVGELVFLAAFAALFWVRTLNPDLWHPARGGEKPMDFAYLNAVVRTTYFPSYDPWFAGGYLNYYYFGQVIVATLIKLTGILPEVSYNLAVPVLFALLAVGAFSIVTTLASKRVADSAPGAERRAWLAGITGALFVAVAGNLDGLAQITEGLTKAGQAPLDILTPGVAGFERLVTGAIQIFRGQAVMPAFDFWRSSRMMPPQISITEFPYFTFLFADLHAHLIALPFTLLAIGLALNVALDAGFWTLVVLALTVGALRPTNSWDFPTYLALGIAAIAISRRRSGPAGFLYGTAWRTALLYVAGYLAFLPFYQSYELFYNGVTLSAETTTLAQYLGVHGLFLFLAISLLVVELQRRFAGSTTERYLAIAARNWDRLPHFLTLAAKLGNSTVGLSLVLGILGIAVYGALSYVGLPVPAFALTLILGCGVLAARILWSGRIEVAQDLFIVTMLAGALGLGAFVDVLTLQGDIARMNTVFKFYLQAWALMGMVAAYAFWRLVILPWNSLRIGRTVWMGVLTVLLVAVFVYPLAATPVRVRDRFAPAPPTDNGLSYMQSAVYQDERGPMELKYDYDAIQWLRQNVDGTPVIVEGIEPIYRWGSRISVNTGLPTVLGWDWHQTQQRWGYQDMVGARQTEVNNFYVTNDVAAAQSFLQKYSVRYVVVGNVETKYYPAASLNKFGQMVGRQLEVAYQNPGTVIYRVLT